MASAFQGEATLSGLFEVDITPPHKSPRLPRALVHVEALRKERAVRLSTGSEGTQGDCGREYENDFKSRIQT
ncbi:hypothetical protein MVI01_52620 [Myxococcus virescens]|uniref:Uncharacterized protein n=1 Tax=Myxococcus virescens TaxID=83456 RepID=A0A511HIT8_9BACT|nr:hypothetical protein MVI01_52620 [Myxococcus virescens]